MKIPRQANQAFILTAMLLLGPAAANGQKNADQATVALETLGASSQVRLRLIDGSSIAADEAWESEQGIWYRLGGMSHLVPRDRVNAIERAISRSKPDLQLAKRLGGGGRGTLDRDGDDRLDSALGKVDTAPGAGTRGGDHAATEQERRTAGGRLGPQGRTRSSHANLRCRLAACPTVSCANIPGPGTPRLPAPGGMRVIQITDSRARNRESLRYGTDTGVGAGVVRGEARGRR